MAAQIDQIQGFSPGVMTQAPLSRPKLKLSSSNVYEVGYKGLFDDKLAIGIDLYYNKRSNIISAPIQASPLVLQPTLASDLSEVVSNGLNADELAQMGLTPETIAGIYSVIAQSIAFDPSTNQPNPLGLIRADQTPISSTLPTLDLAYYNIKSLDYFGLDVSTRYYFTSDLSAYANLTWLSQAYFENAVVGDGGTDGESSATTNFSLNVPDTKIKLGVELHQEQGLNGFLTVRYQNKWNSVNGVLWTGPVDAFMLVDLGVGYSFKNNVSINTTITNFLQESYRAFYGAPKIGRQLIAKMYYHF